MNSKASDRATEPTEPPRRSHRLGTRLILATLSVLLLAHLVQSAHTIWTEQRSLSEQIDARGQAMANLASRACLDALLAKDYPVLGTFVDSVARERNDVEFVRIERP